MPRSASPGGHTRSLVTAGLWQALPPAGQQPHGVREWGLARGVWAGTWEVREGRGPAL